MTRSIYYSVSNCGDGSAYPEFFYDQKCAEVHQGLMEEGWGESCTGSITIHTRDYVEGQELLCSQASTTEEYLVRLRDNLSDYEGYIDPYYTRKIKVLKEAIDYLEGKIDSFRGYN
jgi:hypothetical protein